MATGEMKEALFILKQSLMDGCKPSPKCRKILRKIISIVQEDPGLLNALGEWGFLEKEFICLLGNLECRGELFEIGKQMLGVPSIGLPCSFVTIKGGYFMSELLNKLLDEPNGIIEICEQAIGKNLMFAQMLYDAGFFILLNSIVCEETARLYSVLFAYRISNTQNVCHRKRRDDVMYELRRRHFDPEIVFQEDNVFVFRDPPSMHIRGLKLHQDVFDSLYNTSFFDLVSLGIEKSLHVLNFCDWDYSAIYGSKELRELVIAGNYLGIRLYRKTLQHLSRLSSAVLHLDKIEDADLMIEICKLLESKDKCVVMECALIIYNYYELFEWKIDKRHFGELRIRKIFGLLEFCRSDCACLQQCKLENAKEKCRDSFNEDSMMCDNGLSQDANESCFSDCDARMILCLLSRLYLDVDKRYFYKPSFLVLMREWERVFCRHKCLHMRFLTMYFCGMVEFIGKNCYNVARILFPFKKVRRRKEISGVKHSKENEDTTQAIEREDEFDFDVC
ncbi:hypothetical protein HK407_02g03010 [Ordospora pajunii]|uniref:uncharacterized protein n=1 Tax=Ordospora pajunii TaxID=3039483 RepID=UPI0029529276|nr:uncharacterized protein HK407_02g03010 [Ordospora pajunii]KAH9412077.1 hypothetical protein HK407_02g03010 [Ordospora pajunii]